MMQLEFEFKRENNNEQSMLIACFLLALQPVYRHNRKKHIHHRTGVTAE